MDNPLSDNIFKNDKADTCCSTHLTTVIIYLKELIGLLQQYQSMDV